MIIKVDLATALVLYLVFSLLLVLVAWIWHELTHRQKPLETERKTALRCNICLYAFIAETENNQARCPRCKSWVRIASDELAHLN